MGRPLGAPLVALSTCRQSGQVSATSMSAFHFLPDRAYSTHSGHKRLKSAFDLFLPLAAWLVLPGYLQSASEEMARPTEIKSPSSMSPFLAVASNARIPYSMYSA